MSFKQGGYLWLDLGKPTYDSNGKAVLSAEVGKRLLSSMLAIPVAELDEDKKSSVPVVLVDNGYAYRANVTYRSLNRSTSSYVTAYTAELDLTVLDYLEQDGTGTSTTLSLAFIQYSITLNEVNSDYSVTKKRRENVDGTELTTLMSNIVDSHGNKRFIEGGIAKVAGNTSIEKIYGKWSLSGTHLLLVFCFNHLANMALANKDWIAYLNGLPSYIIDKIQPISENIIGVFPYHRIASNTSSYVALIKDTNNALVLTYYGNNYTPTADEISRIQIDLLIDSD